MTTNAPRNPDRPNRPPAAPRRPKSACRPKAIRRGRAPKPTPCALVHELQVHQIELEMQNEELQRARARGPGGPGEVCRPVRFRPGRLLPLGPARSDPRGQPGGGRPAGPRPQRGQPDAVRAIRRLGRSAARLPISSGGSWPADAKQTCEVKLLCDGASRLGARRGRSPPRIAKGGERLLPRRGHRHHPAEARRRVGRGQRRLEDRNGGPPPGRRGPPGGQELGRPGQNRGRAGQSRQGPFPGRPQPRTPHALDAGGDGRVDAPGPAGPRPGHARDAGDGPPQRRDGGPADRRLAGRGADRRAEGSICNRQPVKLCTVIQRAVEVCKPDIEARRLHFGVDLGPAGPTGSRPTWPGSSRSSGTC